jgi:predicted Zn-dependent protease
MFFAVLTAYCLMKGDKMAECIEILNDYKNVKPSDSITTKYLTAIYNHLHMYAEATELLEYIVTQFPSKKDLQEQLFFAYVREGKLLKQQNQALSLYK